MSMNTTDLFAAALNLPEPWSISSVEFKMAGSTMELHINIEFKHGGKFSCPIDDCNEKLSAYDTTQRTWRHLNFFQYKTYIHASLPRVKCPKHGVKTVNVPWAREGSGFTLLFESWVVELAKHLPVSVIAKMVNEHDTRLWRFIRYYVNQARQKEDYSSVTAIGMDETSKKGHHYVTVVVDLNQHKVIFATNGKDATTVNRFSQDFQAHQGIPEKVRLVTCDMSLGFKKGIQDNFPRSRTIIDKFHVIKMANEAVDLVRRQEAKHTECLTKTKYLWLKNDCNLTEKQKEKKQGLLKRHLKTARAYSMRLELQDIYETAASHAVASQRLLKLCSWMMHSRLEPMKKLCRTIRSHWVEILRYFDYRCTNAILEGINSIIQNIKRRARGFRNDDYFITMIYLGCGKLQLDLFPC